MSKTSNPQKRRRSSQNRPVFVPNLSAGGTGIDIVSGVVPVTSISGTRYGIVNGSVTQFAANQPPIEDEGLRGCPAFTQLATTTETFSGWIKAGISVVSSGNFQGVVLNKLIEDTSTGIHGLPLSLSAPTDSSILGMCCLVGSVGRNFQIKTELKSGAWVVLCKVNPLTDVITNIHASVTAVRIDAVGGGFKKFFIAYNVGVGSSSIYLYPELNNNVAESYTGDGVSGIYFSQPTYINFGVNGTPFIPPYVPNNTSGSISVVSEAATATTGTSFDLDNALLARLKNIARGPQGHLDVTLKSNTNSSWWANSSVYNILSVNNTAASLLYANKDVSGTVTIRTTDGTNVASVTQGLVVGSSYRIAVDWGTHITGQKIRVTVNGVNSSLADCGVSLGAEDLRFFDLSGIHIGWIVKDSLKISDRPQW